MFYVNVLIIELICHTYIATAIHLASIIVFILRFDNDHHHHHHRLLHVGHDEAVLHRVLDRTKIVEHATAACTFPTVVSINLAVIAALPTALAILQE